MAAFPLLSAEQLYIHTLPPNLAYIASARTCTSHPESLSTVAAMPQPSHYLLHAGCSVWVAAGASLAKSRMSQNGREGKEM